MQGLLLDDYNKAKAPPLDPFIATASNLVDRVSSLAATYKGINLDTVTLELIERWLSAHFYLQSDQGLQSKSTRGASGQFQGKTDVVGLQGTKYGQAAIDTDYSRVLMAIDKGWIAGLDWLGKPVSQQIPYFQRD